MADPSTAETAPDPVQMCRRLLRSARQAALGTALAGDGSPYVSLVTLATMQDGRPILLLSDLSDHTRNIGRDDRVSLLIGETSGLANPQTGPRMTLMGRIAPAADAAQARARFLARHPSAAFYAGFGDFGFYAVTLERIHLVGGFARALWIDAPRVRAEIATPDPLAAAMATAEADIVGHMNADHADAVRAMGERLLRRRGKTWRMTAIDVDGCDLVLGKRSHYLPFPRRLSDPGESRAVLIDLVRKARQAR